MEGEVVYVQVPKLGIKAARGDKIDRHFRGKRSRQNEVYMSNIVFVAQKHNWFPVEENVANTRSGPTIDISCLRVELCSIQPHIACFLYSYSINPTLILQHTRVSRLMSGDTESAVTSTSRPHCLTRPQISLSLLLHSLKSTHPPPMTPSYCPLPPSPFPHSPRSSPRPPRPFHTHPAGDRGSRSQLSSRRYQLACPFRRRSSSLRSR